MNLNTRINKTTAVTVPVVLVVLFTLAFLVTGKTPITSTAYAVGLAGSVLFCAGNLFFIGARAGYPWIAAIPMTLWRYIIISTLLSGVFVIGEKLLPAFHIPVLVMLIGHIAVFAFFFVMLLLMHTGQEYIAQVDQNVAVKRRFIKELSNDLLLIKENAPQVAKKDIQMIIEAVRFSDPMSNDTVSALENDITDNVARLRLHKEEKQISALCVEILKQVKERNNLVRAAK